MKHGVIENIKYFIVILNVPIQFMMIHLLIFKLQLILNLPTKQLQQMTAPISEIKRKTTGLQHDKNVYNSSVILNEKDKEDFDILNLNRNKFRRANSPTSPSSSYTRDLMKGRQCIYKSLRFKQNAYKKTENLKLGDYLRLTSLSKRSETSRSNGKNKSSQPLLTKHSTSITKSKATIDTVRSIKVVREQTKKQIIAVHQKLKKYLKKIQQSQHMRSDQQSLVFMCNVLHIFEDRIVQSVKYAQQLIEERKKQKNLAEKQQIRSTYNGMRRFRPGNRSKINFDNQGSSIFVSKNAESIHIQ